MVSSFACVSRNLCNEYTSSIASKVFVTNKSAAPLSQAWPPQPIDSACRAKSTRWRIWAALAPSTEICIFTLHWLLAMNHSTGGSGIGSNFFCRTTFSSTSKGQLCVTSFVSVNSAQSLILLRKRWGALLNNLDSANWVVKGFTTPLSCCQHQFHHAIVRAFLLGKGVSVICP